MASLTCIYKITNTVNDKVYIGSAINYLQRKSDHLKRLRSQTHHNIHLQRHCNKYGLDTLSFEVVERCDRGNILEREQHYIDTSDNQLFNINPVAGSNLGRVFPESTRKKISMARMGKCYFSGDEIEARRTRMLGNKYGSMVTIDDDYRRKQSLKTKGSRNGRAKINETVANAIRIGLSEQIKQSDLARQYGVSRWTVWAIKNGKQWNNSKEDGQDATPAI